MPPGIQPNPKRCLNNPASSTKSNSKKPRFNSIKRGFSKSTLESLGKQLENIWDRLVAKGLDLEMMLSQSMLSPATCCLINPDKEKTVEKAKLLQSPVHKTLRFLIGYIHLLAGIVFFGAIFYIHLSVKPTQLTGGIPKAERLLGLSCMLILAATGMHQCLALGFPCEADTGNSQRRDHRATLCGLPSRQNARNIR